MVDSKRSFRNRKNVSSLQTEEIANSVLAIARAGAGVNNIPVAACTERGIPVFNSPGANANAVKELTIAGLLLASRDIIKGVIFSEALRGKGAEVPSLVETNKKKYGGIEIAGKTLGIIGLVLAIAGVIIQTAALGLRWYESYQIGIGHAPLTNMYESLVFFAWCTTLFYIFMEFKFKARVIGAFVMPFAFTAMAYASFAKGINQQISPLIPALQSNWLIAHVMTCFIGYGAFAVAGGLGLMYLMKQSAVNRGRSEKTLTGGLPELKVIDDLTHKTIVFGFMWLSAGIITGAVWANEAWGTYWSWDPKETWSLITWLVYAALLHQRLTVGWRGKKAAWVSIIGFLVLLFTFLGAGVIMKGYHSFAHPEAKL